jgi:hypothetical protein
LLTNGRRVAFHPQLVDFVVVAGEPKAEREPLVEIGVAPARRRFRRQLDHVEMPGEGGFLALIARPPICDAGGAVGQRARRMTPRLPVGGRNAKSGSQTFGGGEWGGQAVTGGWGARRPGREGRWEGVHRISGGPPGSGSMLPPKKVKCAPNATHGGAPRASLQAFVSILLMTAGSAHGCHVARPSQFAC